ncbi:helix-turn-helix domain-containing protein [Undibacterium sp. TJN19]|uniref:helix-turn-helix domain-containing protein n=1 Tax=Undibacterium sp. TJN19 TaxID=3413055 RepID=UPI003BF3841D
MENTGQTIRKRRIELGFSQESLAKVLGCSQANIAKLEKGSTPDIRIGMLLQRYLGLDAIKLFVDGEESITEADGTPSHSTDEHINAVISMMRETDAEGRIRSKFAVSDTLRQYTLNKQTSTPISTNLDIPESVLQNEDFLNMLSTLIKQFSSGGKAKKYY